MSLWVWHGKPQALLQKILPNICPSTTALARPSLPSSQPHLFEGHRVLDVDIGLDILGRQALQLCVELSHAVLRQQEEEVEAQELMHVG